VRLPFKEPPERLGESRKRAQGLIAKLNKKFDTDYQYAQLYSKFIDEYFALQHMIKVPTSQPEPLLVYYLPHHGVWKASSITTKLRVVFNGSSKTTSGLSLNDLLHTGPKLQTELFDVLIWFRQHRYVFSADIEKMYRQIKIHPEDWDFQRILWMHHKKIQAYQLTTVMVSYVLLI